MTSRGVTPIAATGFDINLAGGSASESRAPTLEDIRRGHLQLQEIFRRIPQTSDPDGAGDNHRTALGENRVNGTAIYGFRDERTHSKVDRAEEHWESELGFRFSESWSNPNTGSSWGYCVINLKRVEPPPEPLLFPCDPFPWGVG